MGVRPLFDDLCRRLATHGFAVCAPEPFARAPVEVRGRRRHRRRAWRYVTQLDDELQIGDLEAAADYLVVHDDVREVAVLGFCMGGMQVLKAAATGRFDRAVAFYGMIRRARGLGRPEDAPAARHRGRRLPDARDLRRATTRSRPRPTSRRCAPRGPTGPTARSSSTPTPSTGSCTRPSAPAHRADDAADAWRRVLAFLLPD